MLLPFVHPIARTTSRMAWWKLMGQLKTYQLPVPWPVDRFRSPCYWRMPRKHVQMHYTLNWMGRRMKMRVWKHNYGRIIINNEARLLTTSFCIFLHFTSFHILLLFLAWRIIMVPKSYTEVTLALLYIYIYSSAEFKSFKGSRRNFAFAIKLVADGTPVAKILRWTNWSWLDSWLFRGVYQKLRTIEKKLEGRH